MVAAFFLAGGSAVQAQQTTASPRPDSTASALSKTMRSMMDEQTGRAGSIVAATTAARAEVLAKPETV
ncbi:MAG TPA: hypothetical protein VIC24_07965 [Gemmatimonadaceae bacterium]|jgi:hypothetical protein